jgi:hypothetical protein
MAFSQVRHLVSAFSASAACFAAQQSEPAKTADDAYTVKETTAAATTPAKYPIRFIKNPFRKKSMKSKRSKIVWNAIA